MSSHGATADLHKTRKPNPIWMLSVEMEFEEHSQFLLADVLRRVQQPTDGIEGSLTGGAFGTGYDLGGVVRRLEELGMEPGRGAEITEARLGVGRRKNTDMMARRRVGGILERVVGQLGGRQGKKVVGGGNKTLLGVGGHNSAIGLKAAGRERQVSERAVT